MNKKMKEKLIKRNEERIKSRENMAKRAKYYEVCLHRFAWYGVKADSPEEAERIAKENDDQDNYDDQVGELMYVPEEIYAKDAKEMKHYIG